MEIRPPSTPASPDYPTARDFARARHHLGAAALGAVIALGGAPQLTAASEQPAKERSGEARRLPGISATPSPPENDAGNGPQSISSPKPHRLLGGAVAKPKPTQDDGTTYRIQKGDTLSGIAAAKLGDANRWPDIVKLNPGLNPKALRVGQTLRIPAPPAKLKPETLAEPPTRLPGDVAPVPKPTPIRLAGGAMPVKPLPAQSEERLMGRVKAPAPVSGEHP